MTLTVPPHMVPLFRRILSCRATEHWPIDGSVEWHFNEIELAIRHSVYISHPEEIRGDLIALVAAALRTAEEPDAR